LRALRRLFPLLIAITLAGCGSAAKPAATSVGTPSGCTQVPPPAQRSQPHLPRPRLRLDASKTYTVRMVTSCGELAIALDVRDAPRTSASFASLVQRRYFDGLAFHRIGRRPDGGPFVIQGGDPLGSGAGGPGYQVVERPPAATRYTQGVVAMAKTQLEPAGASGSQFFIVTAPDAGLPPDYAVVGRVAGGQDTVARIAAVQADPQTERPLQPVVIETATVEAR
jgi:cyclophilin family peptidyl-prolyl cis-trans isomerase